MPDVGPDLSARVQRRQRVDGHVQDPWDFRRAALALDLIRDRHLLDAEVLGDQRRERRHRTAGGAGEDCAERLGLLVVRALVDVGADRPIAFAHRARGMYRQRHVEAVEPHVAVAAVVDVKHGRDVAMARGRSRRQRRRRRHQAGAQDAAIAVLEIIAG